MLNSDIKEALEPLKKNKTLIITVGNVFRKDDGIGPYIGEELSRSRGPYTVINCYDKPENCIDIALNAGAGKTVIIDAARFGGFPGEARLLPYHLIPETTISTHTFPVKIIAKLLIQDTGCPVHFIGIEPADMEFGEGLTNEVRATGDMILEYLGLFEKAK